MSTAIILTWIQILLERMDVFGRSITSSTTRNWNVSCSFPVELSATWTLIAETLMPILMTPFPTWKIWRMKTTKKENVDVTFFHCFFSHCPFVDNGGDLDDEGDEDMRGRTDIENLYCPSCTNHISVSSKLRLCLWRLWCRHCLFPFLVYYSHVTWMINDVLSSLLPQSPLILRTKSFISLPFLGNHLSSRTRDEHEWNLSFHSLLNIYFALSLFLSVYWWQEENVREEKKLKSKVQNMESGLCTRVFILRERFYLSLFHLLFTFSSLTFILPPPVHFL